MHALLPFWDCLGRAEKASSLLTFVSHWLLRADRRLETARKLMPFSRGLQREELKACANHHAQADTHVLSCEPDGSFGQCDRLGKLVPGPPTL